MALGRPLRIVIPGGTGQIGHVLARHFHEQGHDVTAICRNPKPAEWKVIGWDAEELGSWTSAINGSDVVVNLAGQTVNCRYNASNRRAIKSSRTITTALIGRAIAQADCPPSLWLNASTATIYPHASDAPVDEITGKVGADSGCPARWQFSMDVAASWERAFFAADVSETRRIALRSGMIMAPDSGGLFDRFLRLVRYGLGGRAGSGKQYVSWIHDLDFTRAVDFLIANKDVSGVVNLCSPCPLPNKAFMRSLRHSWCTMYVGVPIPGWALDLGAVLLNAETELMLKSRRVVPGRLLKSGFDFHFPNWRSAAQDLVQRWRELHSN